MALSNILVPNNYNIFANTINNNQGAIYSFAANSFTEDNVGSIPAFGYNIYTLVIGTYCICYFNSPLLPNIAGSGTFKVPYPLFVPGGNKNQTTAFGTINIFAGTPTTCGTGILASVDVGEQYITCTWLTNGGPPSNVSIVGNFVINLNP